MLFNWPERSNIVKGYWFLSINMSKYIGKKISENLSGKYNLNLLDHAI